MAQVIRGGGSYFDALAYGEKHQNTQNFLRQQVESTSHYLADASNTFFQGAQAIYDSISGSEALRAAMAARRSAGSVWQKQTIRKLETIGDFQHASTTMRRWLMAEPTVRKMYKEQRIEGFEGIYTDPFEDQGAGEDHYDYRRVMDGMVVMDDDNDTWQATTYYDELLEEDRDLDILEQADIIDSWSNIVKLIRNGGDDPTSRWNAAL